MNEEIRLQAESILDYTFKDPDLLNEALTHASVADTRLKSNERMEFLGDAILGMVVCECLYTAYPSLLEGDMTKIKSSAVSRRTCSEVACQLGLDQFLKIGKGLSSHNDLPESISAAVMESVIAAIYLDGGCDAAARFIRTHFIPVIEQCADNGHQYNFKSVLQQYVQGCCESHATYHLLDEKGPDHAKCFKMRVEIDDRQFPSSWAASKKQSEQQAALNALIELGVAQIDAQTGEACLNIDPS